MPNYQISNTSNGQLMTSNGNVIANLDPSTVLVSTRSTGFSYSDLESAWSRIVTSTQKTEYKYIKSYNYVPNKFNFHKQGKEEDLFLGIELEIDKAGKIDENAKLVIDSLGEQNVYCVHDGSLENGFEIVTHPCTYEYHKTMSYENTFDELSKLGYRSHDVNTCGLHVHFNRNYFAKDKLTQDLCISKLLYLFEKYWEKIVLIARRDSNRFASRFFLSEDETILDMYAKAKDSDKYGVINLQHKDTVEIRIFKGTLNYRTFIATLEFVKTIVKLTRNINIYNIQSVTWNDIESKFSTELKNYINEREEINKKEIKEKEKNRYSNIAVPITTGYGTVRSSLSNDYLGSRYMSVDFSTVANNFSSEWVVMNTTAREVPTIDNMTIAQLKTKISELQRMISRSRNPLEQRELQREIQQYANRIGQLRRRNIYC